MDTTTVGKVPLGYKLFSKVVHNPAMKQDPPEIYGWRAIALACSAGFGAMLFGMDSSIIGGVVVLDAFKARFGLNDAKGKVALANLQANIVSTLQAGCFAGALIAAPIADKLGRKKGLIYTSIVVLIGVILQFNAWGHLAPLYVGRFINGLGVGAASMLVPLYISENVPRAIRGLLTGLYQLFIVTGGMIAFWINYGASLHLPGDSSWVVPLAVQGIPAVLLFGCMLLCNESPRFLAKQDRWEEARAVLCKVRHLPSDHSYIEAEFNEMVTAIENERMIIGGSGFKDLMREMWTIPGNRKRALISITLMICQQMTGTNAINSYAPLIFENLGIKGKNTGLFATGIYGIVKMVTCAFFLLFMADSLGRRRSLFVSSIGQGICMFYIGLWLRFDPPAKGGDVKPAGYVALACIFIFAMFFQFGWGPVCWILVSEIPSIRLRGLNVAMAAATQWLFNFVVVRAVPTMLVTVGPHGFGTYIIFGSFAAVMLIFVWFFIPETKGLSLEAMDALFGVVEHDHEALVAGRMGAVTNMHKVDHDDAHSTSADVREKTTARPHVESV